MKARTIATVAAAGLAALVSGCKSDENVQVAPHFDGTIEANAPACDNKPQVHMNRHGFVLSCGNYWLDYRATNPVCTLQNSLTKYVDYECDGTADEMVQHLTPSQDITDTYQTNLRAIGAIGIVRKLSEASRLAEVLGPQEIDFSDVSAPACDNKSYINMATFYLGGAFSIDCGQYHFEHNSMENTLIKGGNPKQVWFDKWHEGDVNEAYLSYMPVSANDNAAFGNALIQIGAEDVEAQWMEWLKKQ
ncbi:MAG: hypothetical protein WC852_03815 [Candidatus Nanoarchaeia archaeon]|jgi:hypothetical protein